MFATTAPYVITALVSVISWVLSTYYNDVRSVSYFKYEIVKNIVENDVKILRYKFSNLSPISNIENISVSLVCRNGQGCFVKRNGDFAQPYNVEPWAMSTELNSSVSAVSQSVTLPPDMAFEIECYLNNSDDLPAIIVSKTAGDASNIKIVTGENLEIYFARNYLKISFTLWIFASGILILIYVFRPKVPKSADKPLLVELSITKKKV